MFTSLTKNTENDLSVSVVPVLYILWILIHFNALEHKMKHRCHDEGATCAFFFCFSLKKIFSPILQYLLTVAFHLLASSSSFMLFMQVWQEPHHPVTDVKVRNKIGQNEEQTRRGNIWGDIKSLLMRLSPVSLFSPQVRDAACVCLIFHSV